MVKYFTHDLILHLIIFQIVNLVIILSNFWVIHRSRRHNAPKKFPSISILIPARNEELNIESCVRSMLAQDYPCFEILVLDDQSTDQTRNILTKLAKSNPKLKIISGQPFNGILTGKNLACSQLALQAQGEILVFTDADTIHHPQMLKTIITVMLGENVEMVTGYPCQKILNWGEKLLVPFFSWAMYCFNPLILAYQFRIPALASAVGQLLVFRREAYEAIGGHAALGSEIVDDLALARKLIAARLRWRVTYAADLITCQMYRTSQAAYEGFVKNLFAAFNFRFLPFAFVFAWLGVMFWVPLIVTILSLAEPQLYGNGFLAGICLALSLLIWWLPYHDLKLPAYLALLFPITTLANIFVAIRSFQDSVSGYLMWKNREINNIKWKWL